MVYTSAGLRFWDVGVIGVTILVAGVDWLFGLLVVFELCGVAYWLLLGLYIVVACLFGRFAGCFLACWVWRCCIVYDERGGLW